MRVILNGESREVAARNLAALLEECGYSEQGVATARNGEFVHRHLRAETPLFEGDRIEVLAPIEGG